MAHTLTNDIICYSPEEILSSIRKIISEDGVSSSDNRIKKEIRIARAGLVDIARKMVSDGQFSMDDIFGQEELE